MNSNHKSSIRLMPGGFCVSTGEYINITPGADYEERLEDAILNQQLVCDGNVMHCLVETSRLSLSPMIYDEATAEDMYRLTLRESDVPEKILHETSADGTVRISFGISSTLYNFFVRTFQDISFHHPIIAMIDDEAKKIHPGANWMTALATRGTLSVIAYRDSRLQLANCTETMVAQNRAYHVLNTWTQLDLDVLTDTLYIIGDGQEVTKLRNAVSKFIKICV